MENAVSFVAKYHAQTKLKTAVTGVAIYHAMHSFQFGKSNGNYSLKITLYEIKNEVYKSKPDTGDAAADRMATSR